MTRENILQIQHDVITMAIQRLAENEKAGVEHAEIMFVNMVYGAHVFAVEALKEAQNERMHRA